MTFSCVHGTNPAYFLGICPITSVEDRAMLRSDNYGKLTELSHERKTLRSTQFPISMLLHQLFGTICHWNEDVFVCADLGLHVLVRSAFLCVCLGLLIMCFYASLNQFISVLLAFVVLGSAKRLAGKNVSESEMTWVFCVDWDVKP